jgi:peptidyl-prolyl cis-trans isomerase A (cyclophilin A)
MLTRPTLAALLLLMPAVLSAQPAPLAPAPAEKPAPRTVPVALTTSEGTITLTLEVERAPVTAANFLRYVDQKRLDGTTIYRAFTYASDPKRTLKPIAHEPTSKTGLTHDDGAISMARGDPGTANGDFFIILGGMQGLDANPAAPGDNQGYAVFGHVTGGMDIVRNIAAMERSPTLGEGAMKGQMLARPVRILTARRMVQAPR